MSRPALAPDRHQEPLRRFKAGVFQALAHPTRIALVELLVDGEQPVSYLVERLGGEQGNISQHLAILRAKQIVGNRKEGNQVFYSLRDPLIAEVLSILRRYFHAHLSEAMAMLEQMDRDEARTL